MGWMLFVFIIVSIHCGALSIARMAPWFLRPLAYVLAIPIVVAAPVLGIGLLGAIIMMGARWWLGVPVWSGA